MAMNEIEHDAETAGRSDPARVLVRLSAVLSVMMAMAAGVLIWRARDAVPPALTNGATVTTRGDQAPDYTFKVIPGMVEQQTDAADLPDAVADFELIERSGRTVTNEDLLGQPWAVSFIFTRCAGPCPRVTGQMKLLQDRFAGRPVRLVTITVDPERDTPERLANYADNFGADEEQWLFLTKDQQTIYPLIRDSFGLAVQEETGPNRKEGWEITHTTRVVHVDAQGRIRGKYNATSDVDMAQLATALEKELSALKAQGSKSADAAPPVEAPVPAATNQPEPAAAEGA